MNHLDQDSEVVMSVTAPQAKQKKMRIAILCFNFLSMLKNEYDIFRLIPDGWSPG
jgi:hypothetical protein